MKILKHGELILVNGRRGHVGTVRGYAAQYDENPQAAYDRAVKNGHEIFFTSQEPTILDGSKKMAEARQRYWKTATPLQDGETVFIEDTVVKVKFMGDYSDFVHFV
jgi:hypothetical protein